MKNLSYDDLFQDEKQLEKFVKLTDALDPINCYEYRWTLGAGEDGNGCDGITLKHVRFRYQKVNHPAKFVDIIYNLESDGFLVINPVSSQSLITYDVAKAAAVAKSYVANFAALR